MVAAAGGLLLLISMFLPWFSVEAGPPESENLCGAGVDSCSGFDTFSLFTTLIIPGRNDDDPQLRALTRWIVETVGPETPWHVSRFFPAHRMLDVPPTPLETLRRAADLGREAGIAHVYVGNAPELGLEDTTCVACGRLLIERHGYRVRTHLTPEGACPGCGRALAGRGLGRSVASRRPGVPCG